ncbi:MAG TPA: inner membrane-spanning protein YciB [Phenylobacterium sp.]|jgi:intracellular septation protein|uniref:inner membrane-spanning protein YciB n=1 Tax=Phenylobacterium sp. TaxID=1871053 RepID=UPI002D5334AF|nr:inner membrane-spanning protein YciB [Phenylobacterium sp.]HZZ70553.1 inner membrane-spanning protein YciB [Phenylobacterium sp.]
MSEMTPQARALPAWVRYTIDYGGLAAWLLTLVITRSAITSSWVIVGASLLALIVGFVVEKRVAPMPLVTAVFGILFGGLTLFFHDERFIKVKPTILYTVFGLFLITGALRGKNPLKILMGDAFHLPDTVIRTLTIRYALFFFALAIANEVIWRTQSTVFWGLFKFPGVPIVIFLFAMSQAPLMMKHMPDDDAGTPPTERL